MKVVYNKILPPKGFYAITILKWIFIRKEHKGDEGTYRYNRMINHESIHYEQEKELLYIFFYILYVLEWLLKLIPCTIAGKNAYESISFEQEAYNNQTDFKYLNKRKKYNWIRYIFKLV